MTEEPENNDTSASDDDKPKISLKKPSAVADGGLTLKKPTGVGAGIQLTAPKEITLKPPTAVAKGEAASDGPPKLSLTVPPPVAGGSQSPTPSELSPPAPPAPAPADSPPAIGLPTSVKLEPPGTLSLKRKADGALTLNTPSAGSPAKSSGPPETIQGPGKIVLKTPGEVDGSESKLNVPGDLELKKPAAAAADSTKEKPSPGIRMRNPSEAPPGSNPDFGIGSLVQAEGGGDLSLRKPADVSAGGHGRDSGPGLSMKKPEIEGPLGSEDADIGESGGELAAPTKAKLGLAKQPKGLERDLTPPGLNLPGGVPAPPIDFSGDDELGDADDDADDVPKDDKDTDSGDASPVAKIAFAKKEKKGVSKQQKIQIGVGAVIVLALVVLGFQFVTSFFKTSKKMEEPSGIEQPAVAPKPTNVEKAEDVMDLVEDKTVELALTHKWGLKLGKKDDLTIETPDFFDDEIDEFTIELWLKCIGGNGVGELMLVGDDPKSSIRLAFKQKGEQVSAVRLFIPEIGEKSPKVSRPYESFWIHIAGVYTGSSTNQILLFTNGLMTAWVDSESPVKMPTNGISLRSHGSTDDFAFVVDELRISDSALYSGSFQPKRTYLSDDSSLVLFHFENVAEGKIRNFVDSSDYGLPAGKWIDVASDISLMNASTGNLIFPPQLLVQLEERYGAKAKIKLAEDWAKLNNIERVSYLNEIGYVRK